MNTSELANFLVVHLHFRLVLNSLLLDDFYLSFSTLMFHIRPLQVTHQNLVHHWAWLWHELLLSFRSTCVRSFIWIILPFRNLSLIWNWWHRSLQDRELRKVFYRQTNFEYLTFCVQTSPTGFSWFNRRRFHPKNLTINTMKFTYPVLRD